MSGHDRIAAIEAARARLAELEERRFEAIERGGRPPDPAVIWEAEKALALAEFLADEEARA